MSRHAVLALVLASMLAGCSSPSAPDPVEEREPAVPPSATTAAMIDLTNDERRTAGLAELRADEQLMQAAQIHAEQIAAAGRLAHSLPEARHPELTDRLAAVGYEWQAAGENLAYGQRDAAHAVESWMASPGHRANILNATFTEIGTAHLLDGTGRPYYVQVSGRPAR